MYCARGAAQNILPVPHSVQALPGEFLVDEQLVIYSDSEAMPSANYFLIWLKHKAGADKVSIVECRPDTVSSGIAFQISKTWISQKPNAYQLKITGKRISIVSNTGLGIFYGIQSLRQLFPPSAEDSPITFPVHLRNVLIEDYPAQQWRGLLLDCSRHFMPVDLIYRTLDAMALYKMNVLHWHITDDQGWRIEIKKYPLLTAKGSWRKEADGSSYGGFYTQEQIREIVKYASERNIEIVPEIELPGHCSSALAAYPALGCTGEKIEVPSTWGVFRDIYCAGNDSTFIFLENVLKEVTELFPSANIHLGGDEVPTWNWEHCEKCIKKKEQLQLGDWKQMHTWFVAHFANYLKQHGRHAIAWDDATEGGSLPNTTIQVWRGMEWAQKAAEAGAPIVLSPTSHCYLDYPLNAIDVVKVASFRSDTLKGDILGGECNMWTEHCTPENVESRIYPRMLVMADRLWNADQNERSGEILEILKPQYARLHAMHIRFGYPTQPIDWWSKSERGKTIVKLKIKIPEATVDYSLSNTNSKWKVWQDSLVLAGKQEVKLRIGFRGENYEPQLSRRFYAHAAAGKKLTLQNLPASQYEASGTQALIDGVLGGNSFRDGTWQGLWGKDMTGTIDLEENRNIHSIQTTWYHYGDAWIFPPEWVSVEHSADGESWSEPLFVKATYDKKSAAEGSVKLALKLEVKVRFLRITAKNSGPCPDWHKAAGEPTWLFCDEWVVE
jgi:hexosaminidase